MMGFTVDGQADPLMIMERDKRFAVDSEAKRQSRSDIVKPAVSPGADAWSTGTVIQISDPMTGQHSH